MSPATKITLRETGKLQTTTYGNEIATAVNAMIESPESGAQNRDIKQSILVVAKVTGPQDERRGWYEGKKIVNKPNPTADDQDNSQNLELLDFGEESKKINITLWSPGEVLGGPTLATGSVALAVLYGYDADAQELGIVLNATGFFPVLVKWNAGSNGSSSAYASWTYDVYPLWDTGYVDKISSALQPTFGRCRTIKASVTKATDGSTGSAYIDKDGSFVLADVQELYGTNACT